MMKSFVDRSIKRCGVIGCIASPWKSRFTKLGAARRRRLDAPEAGGGNAEDGKPETSGARSSGRILHNFQRARVLHAEASAPDADGRYLRRSLVKFEGAIRLVRVTEIVERNESTGEEKIIDAIAEAADQVVVRLRPDATEIDLQNSLSVRS